MSSEAALQALEPLLRPDFQLFVRDCFFLRWENKIANADLAEAVHKNMSKLKVWSCLYYGTLPPFRCTVSYRNYRKNWMIKSE
jgi:hypothetical protein